MLIDGKQIASEIREKLLPIVARLPSAPVLGIVIVGENPVVESFVRIKTRYGESLGVVIHQFRFPEAIPGDELIRHVLEISSRAEIDGLIIQLPLPSTIDTQAVLNAVPIEKDVDVLSRNAVMAFARGEAIIFPPVAGAVQEILERHNVNVEGVEVLILGHGRLVGVPVSILLRHNHAHVTVIDKPVRDLAEHVRESRIIICGVGTPGLVTPDMLGKESILIDAGTSESGGKIVGDIDERCAQTASIFTPVPGGVGPIAVAMLFRNLVILASARHEKE